MNILTVVGLLKDDAQMKDGKLTCTIIESRQGTGQYAGKTFTKYIKVLSYGRDGEASLGELRQGTLVEASGEADAEAYLSQKDGKPKAMLVIKGLNVVRPVRTSASQADPKPTQRPPSRPAPPQYDNPPESDDPAF